MTSGTPPGLVERGPVAAVELARRARAWRGRGGGSRPARSRRPRRAGRPRTSRRSAARRGRRPLQRLARSRARTASTRLASAMKLSASCGALDLGDVLDRRSPTKTGSSWSRIADGRGAGKQPPLLACRADDVPDDQRRRPRLPSKTVLTGMCSGSSSRPARRGRRKRGMTRSVLCSDRAPGAACSKQVGGRLVGEDDAPRGVGQRDRLGEVDEDRLEPLLDARGPRSTGGRCRSPAPRGGRARRRAPGAPAP